MENVKLYGYTIYSDGKVFGLSGKRLSWYSNGRGYLITRLKWDGKWMTKALHTVVCEAFNGERPDGYEAGHLDGNSYNNISSNIKWMTKQENREQMYRDGRYVGCETNANAKLNNDFVTYICSILQGGGYGSISSLAEELGINRSTLSHIKNRRQWIDISQHFKF